MKKSHLIIASLAFTHLILAGINAAHIPIFSYKNLMGTVVKTYSEYSGADNAYSFFAPSVASQTRVTFLMQDNTGRKAVDNLSVENREVNLRRNTTFSFFTMDETQDLLTRSGAAMMFACYPEATRVSVNVDIYDLPSMHDYRVGVKPEWKMAYKNVFAIRN